jgi:polyhydroxybutyrate depolymerase
MRQFFQVFLILYGIFVFLSAIAVLIWLWKNRTNGSMLSSGEKRKFLLHVPETYDPKKPSPLVISLHGFGEWPAHQAHLTHWNDLADEFGFIVVYPSGTRFPKRWQAFHTPGNENKPNKDIDFISDLIRYLKSKYNIDPNRIYANGFSNGGGLTLILSCQLSDQIAAVGMVSGAYFYSWDACHPSRNVPMIIFHGTEDPIVPYKGGLSKVHDIKFSNIPSFVDEVARFKGCDEKAEKFQVSENVTCYEYSCCDADVIFYSIKGGGHAWPGGERMPKKIVGFINQEIDTTRLMWKFFQEHPRSLNS